MIPVSAISLDSKSPLKADHWQQQMANSLKTASELLNYLVIDEQSLPYVVDHNQPFNTRVTRHLADLIDAQDPYDPILLQLLPTQHENQQREGFSLDPLMEQSYNVLPGLVHKYKNRALLIVHQACAIHCRYCFRRHFNYQDNGLNNQQRADIIDYLQQHPEINEIIFSGGDPLSLSDKKLQQLIEQLSEVRHLKNLRIHTRTPIALPSRITDEFIQLLADCRFNTTLVTHINHPNELAVELVEKLSLLKNSGVTLLNQSVLLKNINDNAQTLCELSEKLFDAGVLPYYLHTPDDVEGTQHFYVEREAAIKIWQQMQAQLSGFLLPRLVKEIPQKQSKTWIIENP